jgi:uncharacterized membrane protein YjjP (DUF1212 family)
MINQPPIQAADLGNLLLKAGTALLKAGAGSNRIVINLMRFAAAYGYEAQVNLGTRHISVSMYQEGQDCVFSGSRSNPSLPGVNFQLITAISQLSWDVTKNRLSIEEVGNALDTAMRLPEYHRAIILALVGVAGAAFCYTFGGGAVEMGITFVATVAGLFFRQEMNRRKYNTFLVTYSSAVVASLIIGLFWKAGIESKLDHAFATSVLFLIPGVPLINSFIDLMDGYIINGIDRAITSCIHAFAIASGLATVLYIFNVQ